MKKIHALKLRRPNRGKFNFCIVYDWASWPERSLRAKGMINSETLYIRNMTPDELEEKLERHRELSFFYETWEQLVSDEMLYGIDANLLTKNSH
jgi:hypothetical protein